MSLLIDPGFGLQFNGISDSVLVPVNLKSVHGINEEERRGLPSALSNFTLETWFIPDCGGVIFEQENVMRLTVGSPSSPAPATFEVRLKNPASGRDAVYTLSTAKPVMKVNGRLAYYEGISYPTFSPTQDGYLATDVDMDDVSAFNSGHRELLNVTVMFDGRIISLLVNGELVVSQTLDEPHELVNQQNNIYLGGRGGDFRGTLEAVHWSRGALSSGYQQYAPVKSDNTLALWRFEEPIEPIDLITVTPSISASTGASSTVSIGATAAQALVDELSGQSGLTSVDFTASPYSGGAYSVKVYAVSSTSTVSIPKVPYNILINPLGYSQTTGKPTNKAPERMRLMSIDASAGTMVVESIHLDFEANASNGRRGALMAHDAGRFVVITGDCIVDTGKGNSFQPYGSGTQFSQRQGQVCIDESDFENHGVVFSQSMAIDSHEFNKFSASTTNMGNELLAGHCGRHTLNHVRSHHYMGALPPTSEHHVEKKLDMSSDIVTASFPATFSDIRSTVPINSVISSYDTHGPVKIQSTESRGFVSNIVENGMSDISDAKRGMLAIGGPNFNPNPFLLKSVPSHEATGNVRHAIPSNESRIASLFLPGLATYNYAPFVQIHYNAVDYEGSEFTTGATSRLTAAIGTSNTVLTLQSIKSFGYDGQVIPASNIRIGATVATTTATVTAKINYSAKTLTFTTAPVTAFVNAATTGAIVTVLDLHPKLLVTKTLPDVSTILTGSYSILDLMRDAMSASELELYSAGGVITFDKPEMSLFSDGDLEGDNSEGLVGEKVLDYDLCPQNYLPLTSSDPPSTTPQAIGLAASELSSRGSVFHRVVIQKNVTSSSTMQEVADVRFQPASNGSRPRTGVFVNNGSGYSASTTGAMTVDGVNATEQFEVGNDVYKANGKDIGTITAVTSTSITIGGGTASALVDNEELFNQPQIVGRGTTNQSTCVNEYFDIIEHNSNENTMQLVIQPSDRNRFNMLSKVISSTEKANRISIESLVSRARVLSFSDGNDGQSIIHAHGITSDLASSSVYVKGSAAPDSHIVKEIMPGAPVVTMTLGGVGQGAVNTKETYDPSPLARLAWNTRRDCQANVSSTTSSTVVVKPLNNRTTDLQSWGTYCFPKVGYIYLEVPSNNGEPPRFASALYTSKTGTTFTFTSSTGRTGTGDFVLADGSEADSLAAWITATGIEAGSVLHVDDKFSEETMCNDGTTINDRLFQTLDTVQHDYQLGTQYASTRAMVEIPLFEEFFFDKPDRGIFPGPDNSMKIHIDATHTAHSWAPSPVGRRVDSVAPKDPEIFGPFSYAIQADTHRSGTRVTQPYDTSVHRIYVENASLFPIPSAPPVDVAGLSGSARYRRAFLANGEWVIYSARDTTNNYLTVIGAHGDDHIASEHFFRDIKVGAFILPAPGYQDMNYTGIADNPSLISAGYENRRSFYHDRSNVMTQGGNVDYGLRQYVSAIELRDGPSINPHLPKIQSKRPRAKITVNAGIPSNVTIVSGGSGYTNGSHTNIATASGEGSGLKVNVTVSGNAVTAATIHTAGTAYEIGDVVTVNGAGGTNAQLVIGLPIVLDDASLFPKDSHDANYKFRVAWRNASGTVYRGFYDGRTNNTLTIQTPDNGFAPSVGDEVYVEDLYATATDAHSKVKEAFLNRAWAHPYCVGGLRQGDTVWMNMHYTNPHAIEGLFCKSRGTLNEAEVWKGFTGGVGSFNANPRDSIPMENFLIGDSCIETAQNLVQHINKTIEMNYDAVGLSTTPPVVAYIDPYQCTGDFARVLLYDVSQDREFIAFQDIHMQVQSSPAAASIGGDPTVVTSGIVKYNVEDSASFIDVAAGFPSQSKSMASDTKSDFIEASYSHNSTWNESVSGGLSTHDVGGVDSTSTNGYSDRTNNAVVNVADALAKHDQIDDGVRERSTFFDTPDGTRVIPAFLAMKGIRNTAHTLTDTRLKELTHWTEMDFVRRLSVDLGEVSLKDGVTNIESAAREVIRLINQAGAKNGKTHARRPNDQFLGENQKLDPSSPHQKADFAATASTHDPAPFWDTTKAFSSHDRGTHMGYVRAHLGRVVLDSEGNQGFSVVIHSTVPGAGGRNFCTWLDSSRAQTPYRPQFLIGHGGRFRNYWCQPDEVTGENMHPAPMPINRFGRPFAPITTLKEYLPPENTDDEATNNLNFGVDTIDSVSVLAEANTEIVSGRTTNTLLNESFETKSPASVLVDGLRIGTKAKARINFGGMTQAGIPGWSPDLSRWGFTNDGTVNVTRYGSASNADAAMTVTTVGSAGGYIPKEDMKVDNIGNSPLYGLRFTDHRGDNHTIRLLYKQFGKKFSGDNTYLPSTLDEEVIVHFDDRDVSQGGFTIGSHMVGNGEVCGELTGGTLQPFKGNLWNTYPSPHVGVHVEATLSGTTLEVILTDPYHNGGSFSHPDILGYLGFPKSGMLQTSDDGGTGDQGMTTFYTSRSQYGKAGDTGASNKHYFYGVTNTTEIVDGGAGLILSPRINFTCLLTDEVMAAAVAHAINMEGASQDNIEATSFDCTHMYAPDGKTLGEWGVSPTAIRIKVRSDSSIPLNKLFEADVSKDWGLLEGVSTETVDSGTHLQGLTTADQDAGVRLDIGYIPHTLLHINTKYRGSNANTATPILIDSQNNAVDTVTWRRNLRGENYTDVAGDHIIPRIDSPCVSVHAVTSTEIRLDSNESWALLGKLACNDANSWGEPFLLWHGSADYAMVRSKPGSTSTTAVVYVSNGASADWASPAQHDILIKGLSDPYSAIKTDGVRIAGSKNGNPFLYFRGGQNSPDHYVPLYFGGGFSGVVTDINDGTQNDYSDFYTHPYSKGPTGSAGLQNVGELAGSYALLDTNAMMAMFPGTPYLDQHRGQNNPPFFNQDAILPFDMAKGANSKVTGLDYTDGTNSVHANIPSPLIVRFAHPHARYTHDSNTNHHTTYMIFGPGQAFPHSTATTEPQGANIVTAGNGYSAVPIHIGGDASKDSFLPNQLANGDLTEHSGFNRGSALAHLPMTTFFQKNNAEGFNYVMNWQPTKGFPSVKPSSSRSYSQTLISAFFFEGTAGTAVDLPKHYHPFNHIFTDISGNSIESSSHPTTRKSSVIWHMDGGYHPGGHFLDNHLRKNPKNHAASAFLSTGSGAKHNASAFRPGALLAQAYLTYYGGSPDNQKMSANVILVDATRCQNSEELGAVLSGAINTFPGTDPLKAIGGTFMPSMQNAHKQDRYGWVELAVNQYTVQNGGTPASIRVTSNATTLPDYGWLRVSNGTLAGFAPYVSQSIAGSNTTFTLGKSNIASTPSAIALTAGGTSYPAGATIQVPAIGGSGLGLTVNATVNGSGVVTSVSIFEAGSGYLATDTGLVIEGGGGDATLSITSVAAVTEIINPQNRQIIGPDSNYKAYIWAKAGTHRFNNAASGAARDHMTQVHFGGFTDAVDRTKPVGAVGWHGEAYSYLNSYEATNDIGANLHPAGLGAWHSFLGFNPYGAAETCTVGNAPTGSVAEPTGAFYGDYCVTGLFSRHLVAVSHEGELPIIAKADANGISGAGDWLHVAQSNNIAHAGTMAWDTNKVNNKSRYVGPATAGPHVEAQVHTGYTQPHDAADYPNTGAAATDAQLHRTIQSGDMVRANACNYPTGDLFWDESVVKGSMFHEDAGTYAVECIGVTDRNDYLNIGAEATAKPHNGLYDYYNKRSAARNFLPEHVVWKRMDGGSLTMPAVNARGLGMIPWTKRKDGGSYKLVGEKILGNVRFSFETTNAAMFPIIQAQELSHPQLAEQHPLEVRNALLIPNEHIQFESVSVMDDTGQEHRLEGGSPLGTVIMDFRHISDREIEGLAPALAGAGVNPNLKIRLPNPDEIPGNIVVRSGFDRIQAYQNESFGSGGLQHPAQNISQIRKMFDYEYAGPRLFPTWENNGWEHLSQDAVDVSTTKSAARLKFPASSNVGWEDHTDNAPLQSSYEPHDRSIMFHVTRMGVSMTHRHDVDELTYSSYSGTEITVGSTPETPTWTDLTELSGGRYFLRVYDPTTDKGVIASYTGIGTNKFTGVVYSPDFVSFVTGKTGLKVVPSYYMPAGSTRLFAARRLRDQSEYSGASPDMKSVDWFTMYGALPANTGAMAEPSTAFTQINKPKMTPMPIPRMGHHYVTPTMALMPGHYAHPAYQRLYDLNTACKSSNYKPDSDNYIGTLEGTRTSSTATLASSGFTRDPLVWFSTATAGFGPSDIHGGAFTLLTETKVKYEGYGIAASAGSNAGIINSQGGHTLVLEAGNTYTLNNHFPDPLEVGAYQIIIQPNVFKQQLQGFHLNHSDAVKAPSESGTKVTELTGQQVNTVIAIERNMSTRGGYALILAEAMMADVRGCEVILNEVILDIEPDAGSQFTNLAPLALYNPLGVQESSSPSLTRRSLPYRPGMFESSTPGRTLTIPWWGILHKDGAESSNANKFRHIEWHKPDNYYELCRVGYGSVGAQLTLAGYPTTYLDIYEPHKRIRSLNPNCVVISQNGSNTIVVDNNDLFPVKPYYDELLVYYKNGIRYTATYANRTGTLAHATLGESDTFSGVSGSAEFWANIGASGAVIHLSKAYDNGDASSLYTNSKQSIMTRSLPQLANGSRDTNSLHTPDAFLCMWHPNLGRPFTWYSDTATGGTRNFYTNAGAADTPVDKRGYNHVPEHFETIHYHDFNYVASKGPFAFGMKWIKPEGTGESFTAAAIDGTAGMTHQGGTVGSNKYNFAGLWPGGSHGGGAVSRLESYGHSLIGWGSDTFGMDCETYQDSTGVATLTLPNTRNRCFGYRMGVRQLYNRPRWSPYVRGWLEVANANAMLGYYHGPLIQQDSKTGGWDYVGSDSAQADQNVEAINVGILERITQVSSLLGQDQIGRQVRYSDGRRMTSSFGCPVRTLRNASTTTRLFPNDEAGQGVEELAKAHRHYMVDWWGNTRGEDVRRFPVRGFGLRPSWDPEDAYADTNVAHRPAANDLFGGDGGDRYSGNDNSDNNAASNMGTADWFNPASAMRVGDRGDGRGVRWPTVFNESLLMDVSETHDATGLVLSHSTTEPIVGQGLVRPSNLTLQDGEVERGISDRIDLNSDDGLLKPSANVGEATETVNADNRGAEPVARNDVRIGLDVDTLAELNDGVSREYVVMSTEAHSLHADKEVGQRTSLRGAYDVGSRTLKDLDMTALNWSDKPVTGVVKHSNAHAMWSLGGTYIMEWSKYSGVLDVKGWGTIQRLPQTSLELWLKADSLDLANGAAVTTWKDSSGNGKDFTQGTVSSQPDFVASDSDFNNQPLVHFDGDDALSTPFSADLNPNNFTVFVVSTVDSDDGNYHGIVDTSSGNTGWLLYARMSGSTNYWQWRTGTGSGQTTISAGNDTVVPNTPSIVTLKMAGSDGAGGGTTAQTLYVNGVSAATSSAVFTKKTNTSATPILGDVGSFELTGQMAEVIIYSSALGDEERQQVETYLAIKYGITSPHGVPLTTSSNPYSDANHDPSLENVNYTDSDIQFIYRPSHGLDYKHSQMFRAFLNTGGPQAGSNFYRATAGGKYGLFTSDAPSARTGTPSSPPYAPVYSVDPLLPIQASSSGPKIQGVDVTGYDKADIRSPVTRMVMSENTLEHFRSDASRRSTDDKEGDYEVQPRFSQALHPKGSKGDASYNTGDHSGE